MRNISPQIIPRLRQDCANLLTADRALTPLIENGQETTHMGAAKFMPQINSQCRIGDYGIVPPTLAAHQYRQKNAGDTHLLNRNTTLIYTRRDIYHFLYTRHLSTRNNLQLIPFSLANCTLMCDL